ncbi:MAG: NADH-quinone oxidoreductase subunit N [Bacteroidetes bacterium]|nr:NADH-quinone oxidoreductase subunit N [Bacteroidota bacterium]MBS1649070.1 NADH-quinone oxidoreductase subunit N [Bacteroidota bacterium]
MPENFFILFKQELWVIAIIFLLLLIKLKSKQLTVNTLLNGINILLLLNFINGFFFNEEGRLFGKMFVTNHLYVFEKNILNLSVLLISLQSTKWLENHKHIIEFYVLLLSSLLGMFLMISSANILMLYVGLELSTIPLAAAANFDLKRKTSGEGAMKLIISSAFSSAILLLGISFLYGCTGTLDFSVINNLLQQQPLHIAAFLLFFVGLLFKVSAVPFHLWTADVYEGSPVAITSFLSVASKSAAIFVILNVLNKMAQPLFITWHTVLIWVALITIIIGNLFAIRQQNLKRLLAFSSIAQVGFILLAVSTNSSAGNASIIYFILIYVLSNLAVFGVITLVSAVLQKETITDYQSFYTNNKFLSWCLCIGFFSLAGVPPTAGFFGKLFLLMSAAQGITYTILAIAALNMVISMYYYLRVVKTIFAKNENSCIEKISIPASNKIALIICVMGVLLTGILSGAYNYIISLQ